MASLGRNELTLGVLKSFKKTSIYIHILTINVISDIVYFHEIIPKSSRNVYKTTSCLLSKDNTKGADLLAM